MLLAFLAGTGALGAAEWHRVDTWGTDQGLPHPRVTALAPARDGSLWVGTDAGLARFDGVRFQVEPLPRGSRLREQKFAALLETPDGTLYAGAEGALFVGRSGQLIRHPDSNSLGDAPILGLVEHEHGVWMLTSNRLCRVGESRFNPVPEPPGVPPPWTSIHAGPRGELWLVGRASAAVHAAGGWKPDEAGLHAPIVAATLAGDRLCVATRSGEIRVGTGPAETRLGARGPIPTAIAISGEGAWVGHDDGLILRGLEAGGRLARWALPGVECLRADDDGVVWAGLESGGLARIRPLPAREWREPVVAPSPAKWIGADARGGWRAAGTAEGIGYWLVPEPAALVGGGDESARPAALRRRALPDGWTRAAALAPSPDGGWIATADGRLGWQDFASDTESVEVVATGLPRVLALWPGAPGNCWVVTERRLALATRPSRLEWQPADRPSGYPRALLHDVTGDFLATDRGLWRKPAGEGKGGFERIANLPPARNLARDNSGRFWFGTFRRELGGWDGTNQVRTGASGGLPDAPIEQLVADAGGGLWLAMGPGLFFAPADAVWKAASSGQRIDWQRLSPADGTGGVEFTAGYPPNALRDADGRLWFATLRGVLQVGAPSGPDRPPVPRPIVRHVRGGFGGIDLPTGIEVGYARRALGFEFAPADLVAPELASYRVRLDGEDWTSLGAQRHWVSYEPPVGRHVLEVEVTDHRGQRRTQSLPVTVGEPWWRTPAFFVTSAMVLACIALAITYAVRLRYRLLRTEADRRLLAQREEISRDLHDSIGAELARLGYLCGLGPPSAPVLRASLREIRESLDEMVFSVDPRKDHLDSFLGYLAEMAQRLVDDSDLRLEIDFPESVPVVCMGPQLRHAVLLAARESIANTLRHSRARRLALRARWSAPVLELVVDDDGIGFDPNRVDPNRNGLANQRRRLAGVGGECHFESAPGEGTRARFRVTVPT